MLQALFRIMRLGSALWDLGDFVRVRETFLILRNMPTHMGQHAIFKSDGFGTDNDESLLCKFLDDALANGMNDVNIAFYNTDYAETAQHGGD